MNEFWQQRFLGIKRRELGLVLLFYFVFALAYNVTLHLTSNRQVGIFSHAFLEYALKGIITIPIWWLMFKKLAHWEMWKKVGLHILILPFFTFGQQQVYYAIVDYMDEWHLGWPAAWWDIYIPGLFYVLQFGVFHVYDYYQKLIKKEKLEAELRQVALKSELTALKSQLNPHFLYNTFNTISASVPPAQEKTRELIAKFADLFRYQLQGSKKEFVTLQEELDFIQKYLELEQERYGERLQFEFGVDKNLLNHPIPPMILQPLVENAVRHGIAPQIEGGKIEIQVKEKENNLVFKIIDNGVGFGLKHGFMNEGVGLANTRKRLEKMYGSVLEIMKGEEKGTVVKFELPSV